MDLQQRGDVNEDGLLNVLDIVKLVDFENVENNNFSLSFDGDDNYVSLTGPPASGDQFSIASKFFINHFL